METKQPDMIEIEIKLENKHLEYLKSKNIDISEFTRSKIDKLIAESKKDLALGYFENPFTVCSKEWYDRSLINSLIWTITLDKEGHEEAIKDYNEYIQKDIDRGLFPNPACHQIQKYRTQKRKELSKLSIELTLLKREDIPDQRRIEMYWNKHRHVE